MAAKKAGMKTGTEVARITVKVSPDTKKFRGELKDQLKAIEKGVKCKIRVEPKGLTKFREDVKRAASGIEAKVKVTADDKALGESVSAAARKTKAKAKVDVDENWLKRGLGKAFSAFEMPNFGTGINLTGYLVIAAALSVVLAPLAGLLTGLLLSLPGLLSLVLTPIAAVALGLEGLKEAAKALEAPFNELKAVMSDAFKADFAPVFETLRNIFPTLKESMPAVSHGLADIGQAIANVVTSPENMKLIGDVIQGIGSALTAAAPGIGNFVQALLTLTNNFVNGGALSGVVDWFNGAMESFSSFMKQMDESGQLDTVFASLGAVLKVLADGLGAIAKIGLDTLADPEAMMAFMAILKGTIAIIVGAFAASKAVLHGVTVAMQWVVEKAIQVGVFFSQLGAKINAAFQTVLNVMRTVAGAISQAWNTVVGVIGNVVAQIQAIVSSIGTALSGIWNNITSAASTAWNGVVSVVQGAWNAIVSAVQTAVSSVTAVVSALPGQIQGFFAGAAGWLVGAGKAIIEGLVNGIKSMVGVVKGAISSVLGGLAKFIPHSPAKEGPFSGQGWRDLASGGEAIATQFGDGFESGFQSVLEKARSLAQELKVAMTSGGDTSGLFGDLNSKDLKTMMSAIEEEKKRLKVLKNNIPKEDKEARASLQRQIEQLQSDKDALSYQNDRVKNSGSSSSGEDPFVKAASGLMKSPVDFAKATGKQFMSDLGISGDGFISKAITEGIQYVFNIGSVDEALSIKDRTDSKAALSLVGR